MGARARGPSASASSISGHSAARRGLEVVDDQLVGQVGGRGGHLAQRGRRGRPRRAAGPGGRPRGRRRRSRARACDGQHEHAVGRRRRERRQALAGAGRQVAPRAHLGGDVGAQPGADLAQERVVVDPRRAGHEPQSGAGVGAAAAPCRRRSGSACRSGCARGAPSQPGPLAKARAAPRRRGSRPRPRGRSTRPRPRRGRRARARPRRPGRSAGRRVTSSWRPSSRVGPR